MATRIKIQKEPNPDVRSVFATTSVDEANRMLATGKWLFVHAGCAHVDDLGYNVKPLFILAATSRR